MLLELCPKRANVPPLTVLMWQMAEACRWSTGMGASQSRQEGQRTTFAIFPSSSSIPSLFVGNKHTDVEKVKHTFISRSCKVQNGGLISGQLSFKQRLRDTASFYLVTLLSSTPGFRGHHALLHQVRKEGKHKREGCKWKVVMCQARK